MPTDCGSIDYKDQKTPYADKVQCIFGDLYTSGKNEIQSYSDTEKQIFLKQQDLMNKINEFNKFRSCYFRKHYNQSENPEYPLPDDSVKPYCQTTYNISKEELDEKKARIIEIAREIKTMIVDIDDGRYGEGPSLETLAEKRKYIEATRNDLDDKIKELNEVDNSQSKLSKLELDSTVYISMMWTTLAACLIYYSFTEL